MIFLSTFINDLCIRWIYFSIKNFLFILFLFLSNNFFVRTRIFATHETKCAPDVAKNRHAHIYNCSVLYNADSIFLFLVVHRNFVSVKILKKISLHVNTSQLNCSLHKRHKLYL